MNRLKNFKINISSSISKALNAINKNMSGACFVVDDKNILRGVVTDGDIRRAILKKKPLSTKVSKIIKKDFFYLNYKSTPKIINKSLNKNIKIIPLVNKANELKDFVTSKNQISLAKPNLSGNELKYLTDCINTGWISSIGKYVNLFEKKFSNFTKIKHCLPVSNGTTALHLALKTLDIGEDDEVIVPNLTFASPVNSVIHCGAKPVFVDVKANTYCIDENEIKKKITKKTKAIIVVHLYGHPANMKKIKSITKNKNIFIIEDCAEALGSYIGKKHVGLFGDIATFSFFGNKMITTGEGGMMGFKSTQHKLKAEILRDHGMSKKVKYWHNHIGFNFRLTNLQSSIGCAQLERIQWFIRNKLNLAKNYRLKLSKFDFIILPGVYGNVQNSYWLYTIRLSKDSLKYKDILIQKMQSSGIEARPIFYPMNMMNPYQKYIKKNEKFPVSELLFNSSISLPSAYDVKLKDITIVSNFLKNFKNLIDK
jgi:perosamine synthetase